MFKLYFAYGSNLWPGRLAARIGEFDIVSRARLSRHRLSFSKRGGDGSAKCNVESTNDAGDFLTGALYAINDSQRGLLDVFEGLGHGYHREYVELTRDDVGERVEAFVYSASPGHVFRQPPAGAADDAAICLPFCWYKKYVLRGAHYHGFSAGDIAEIEAQASQPDGNLVRLAKNQHILSLSLTEAAKLHGTHAVT